MKRKDLDVPPEIRVLDRATLERRLADADAKLESSLLPYDQFHHSMERTSKNEERLRTVLDQVFFTNEGVTAPYHLECHGRICLVESVGMRDWQEALQTDPAMVGVYSSAQFVGDAAYVKLEELARTVSIQLLIDLTLELQSAPSLAECTSSSLKSGVMVVALILDAVSRRVTVQVGGALANEPVAQCVREAATLIVNARTLPTDITSIADWAFSIEVP